MFTDISNMTVIVPSDWLAGIARKSFLKNYPIKVIYNGIDLKNFSKKDSDFRERYNLRGKFIILGVAAVWSDSKGLSDYFKLSEILDDNYKIVLVGLTKKQIKKIPCNILGIQRTESVTELACVYSAANIFVNLTYSDNYPTVNLEAIACDLPILTYNTGGSTEIAKKFGGLIVPRGNIEEVKSKILKFRKKPISVHGDKKLLDKSYTTQQYMNEYILNY